MATMCRHISAEKLAIVRAFFGGLGVFLDGAVDVFHQKFEEMNHLGHTYELNHLLKF